MGGGGAILCNGLPNSPNGLLTRYNLTYVFLMARGVHSLDMAKHMLSRWPEGTLIMNDQPSVILMTGQGKFL